MMMEMHYSYQMILGHFVLPTCIPPHDKHGFRDLTYHCVDNIGNAVLVLCRASRSAGHTKRLTEKTATLISRACRNGPVPVY